MRSGCVAGVLDRGTYTYIPWTLVRTIQASRLGASQATLYSYTVGLLHLSTKERSRTKQGVHPRDVTGAPGHPPTHQPTHKSM